MAKTNCPECFEVLRKPGRCDCGWREFDKDRTIQPFPKECTVDNCRNDTDVAWAVAQDPNGQMIRANGGKVLFRDHGELKERQGYQFHSWITRCSDCYLREMDRINHGIDPAYQKNKELKKSNPELFFKPTDDSESLEYGDMTINYMREAIRKVVLPRKQKVKAPEYNEKELLDQVKEVVHTA